MAVERAGIVLVAEGYDEYMNKLRQINAQQAATFGGGTGTGAMANVARQTQTTTNAMGGLAGALGTVKGAMGAVTAVWGAFMAISAVRGLKKFIDDSATLAMRNETLAVSLAIVGKQAGYSAAQIQSAEVAVKNQGITTQAARQSLIRLAQANIEFADAANLARIAQDAAVIGHINSSEAFERMIYGIQSGQVEVLKTIGINVQFEASYRKMAQQLNKGRLELTEAEKAQARVNAVTEAGKRIAGTYEAAMGTAGKQQQSMARYIEETQFNLGKLMLPWMEFKVSLETLTWKNLQKVTETLVSWEPYIRNALDALREFMGMPAQKDIGLNLDKQKQQTDALGDSALRLSNSWLVPPVKLFTMALHEMGIEVYDSLGEGETLADRFSRALYEIPRITHLMEAAFAGWGAAVSEAFMEVGRVWKAYVAMPIEGLQLILKGDVEGFKALQERQEAMALSAETMAGKALEVGAQAYNKSLGAAVDAHGTLMRSYEEYQAELAKAKEQETNDLKRQKTAADLAIEGLDKQAKSLEGVLSVMKQVEKVQRDYNKGVGRAGTQRNEALADLEKQTQKDRARAADKFATSMVKLDEDYAREMADIRKKQAVEIQRAQADLYRTLKRMDEAYQLERSQSGRRFEVSARRLRAEGDVLGLMQLREDYDIQQQEDKENYQQGRKNAKEDGEEKLKQSREDMQRQIDELGAGIQERRAQLAQTYQDELDQLTTSQTERRAEIQANYLEQLEDLRTSRDEQLALLGESLRDEGVVTDEGMKRLQGILNSLFGENQAGDALMRGWTTRSTAAITLWADTLSAEIARIQTQMEAIAAGGPLPVTGGGNDRMPRGVPNVPSPYLPHMRTGGMGVVTGPAMFEVEPGHREFFMFAPTRGGRQMSQTINAIVSGGIDIRGAEGASQSVVNAAVTTTLGELKQAIKRMGRQ